jgi:predicted 2-oxoglutarate/Fe(II)-dependent dioxygenase YbiX
MDYPAEIPGVFAVTLYEAALCRFLVTCANETDGWVDARIHGDVPDLHHPDVVDPEMRNASILPLWHAPAIARTFDESIRQVVTPLVDRLCHVYLPQHAEAQIVRYQPGGRYIAHQDRGPGAEDRYFTVLCYLNDDFAGGATRFPDFNHSEMPRCGKAIIFPAEYRHCAEPVIDGCKYILVSWLVGPAPVRWI